ncbi:MAG: glycosyltransferase, partial [Phototrophicales bacterium]
MTNTLATISIIIPVLNEAAMIAEAIARLQSDSGIEVIVADGGSRDRTVEVVLSTGAKVVSTPDGRAAQMNLGAAAATGEILLFLHVDTRLPDGYQQMICDTLATSGVVAGAFELGID